MIRAVRHAGIVVEDLERMLAFYCGVLGLELRAGADEAGSFVDGLLGFSGAQVTTAKLAAPEGPTLVELLRFTAPPSPPRRPLATNTPGPTHIAFTVADLDALRPRLEAAGAVFNAPPALSPDGRAKVAYIRDPEGNFLELVEPVAP